MRKTLYVPALLLTASALAWGPVQGAKLYKWVDADGNVTYSQHKPPDRQAEQMEIKGHQPADPDAPVAAEEAKDKAETGEKDRKFAGAAQEAQAERESRMRKNCEIARQNLRVLTNSARIQAKGTDGKPYFLNADDIQARIGQTQKQIADWCG